MLLVGGYSYFHSSGSRPDRKIEFYGDGDQIEARVSACVLGIWQTISVVNQENILCEGESLSSKLEKMKESRIRGVSVAFNPDRKFSDLTFAEKENLIKGLMPMGKYRLEIRNEIGQDPRFEQVSQIGFFDPT